MSDPDPAHATDGMDPGPAGSPERERYERAMAGVIAEGIRRRCQEATFAAPGVMLHAGEVLLVADSYNAAEREVTRLREHMADIADRLRAVSDGMTSQPFDGGVEIGVLANELANP